MAAMRTRDQTMAAEARTGMTGREATAEVTGIVAVVATGTHLMLKEEALVVATAETAIAVEDVVVAGDNHNTKVWTMSTMATVGLTTTRMLSTNIGLTFVGRLMTPACLTQFSKLHSRLHGLQ